MTAETKVTVRVTRKFDASAERVFDAWLDPAKAGKWLFATPTGQMVRAEVDARVGGKFRFVDRREGEDVEHVGEYLELVRPRRLVFTFAVPKYSSESSRVTVEITSLEKRCELTLTNDGVLREYAGRTDAGWRGILDGLAATISQKEAAMLFLRMVAAGKIRDAYRAYVAEGFKHHNPYCAGDAASLMKSMEDDAAQNPNKVLEIHRALEDGDLVAVYSHVRQKPGDRGFALVHLFRFAGGRVVEAWDVAQPVPADSVNQHGTF